MSRLKLNEHQLKELFIETDTWFGTERVQEGYDKLVDEYNQDNRDPNLLWRIARFAYESALEMEPGPWNERFIEAIKYGKEAFDLVQTPETAKWCGVCLTYYLEHKTYDVLEQNLDMCKESLRFALKSEGGDRDVLVNHLIGRYYLHWSRYEYEAVKNEPGKIIRREREFPEGNILERALEIFKSTYEIDPQNFTNVYYMARTYEHLQQSASALQTLEKMHTIEPKNEYERRQAAKALRKENNLKQRRGKH